MAAGDRRAGRDTLAAWAESLPHLAAIAILLAGSAGESGSGNRGLAQLTGPAGTATLIDQLRADGTVLTYDPVRRTLRAGGRDALTVTIGKDH